MQTFRKAMSLSVNGLALKAGVSAGMISQIERNKANPSLKILDKLRIALDVPLSAFLEGASPVASTTRPIAASQDDDHIIRRLADRPKFNVGSAPLYKELLSPSGAEGMQFMIIRMPPHAKNEDVVIAEGQKGGLVIEGELTLSIQGRKSVLHMGDSFQFEGNCPHGIYNNTDSDVVVLWIMTSFRPIHM
ncbi:helix-turn-helix domain-containing protein [Burkholderia sp. WSM2232]|uniref:helix-turn-helix domain-containing protein n=1 Tax=Burkholderia sp. WSM2232 TaxID=944436 RepID=UPI000687D8D9|nr:cupin domain-containing protein [Burkholderia sp. WSM2232]